ncbi:MAG: ACT domain-containing protein [Candidatus Altiarchaeia archaeon]
MVKQINVFSENKPGKLEHITKILSDAGVNIRAMKISSSDAYGVIKLLVDDPEKGFSAYKKAGVTVSLKEVLAVEVSDKSGALHQMLSFLAKNSVNIEDCYGFVIEDEKKAVIVLELDDPVGVAKFLEKNKYNIIGSSKLYDL